MPEESESGCSTSARPSRRSDTTETMEISWVPRARRTTEARTRGEGWHQNTVEVETLEAKSSNEPWCSMTQV
jgi:hypothetical protein